MDIVLLENPSEVGLVGGPALETLDGGVLIPKRLQKSPGEGLRIERLLYQPRYRLFNFNGIHH